MENIEKSETYKELSHKIDEWLGKFDAWFDTEKVWRQFNVVTRAGKANVWKILDERVEKGILEFKYGKYRRIDTTRKHINFRGADTGNWLPLKFPKALLGNSTFGLENLVRLFPKSIIIVAGPKGACKSALMLNWVRENMNSPELSDYLCRNNDAKPYTEEPIVAYFSNEFSDEELADRLENFGEGLDVWNIIAEERYDNFADVVYPNKINFIDALEVNIEAYRVADLIDAIHKKLRRGAAIISMHKNANAEYAAGGIYTAKKARLYLIIQANTLFVKHAKKTLEGVTAEGRKWTFKLVDGAKFVNIQEDFSGT